MEILLIIIHVIVSLFLIIVVLLQSGKAADLAGAFGGMGSQTAFGPRGSATLLSKATTFAAVLFMLTSITLGIVKSRDLGVVERDRPSWSPRRYCQSHKHSRLCLNLARMRRLSCGCLSFSARRPSKG